MINKLTEEQKQWVRDNKTMSMRQLAFEFEQEYQGSFNPVNYYVDNGNKVFEYSQIDGMWLCEQVNDQLLNKNGCIN